MATISPYAFFQETDNNGLPLAGGKLHTYEAGTTTPKVTFTSEDESANNTNPIILDAGGRADVWLDTGSYKFVLTDANDVEIKTVDNITSGTTGEYASNILPINSNTNVTASDEKLVLDCTGTITLSLLAASTAGDGFIFTVKNSGAGVVTLDPDGLETIDLVGTKDIQAGGSVNVNCDGSNWITTNEGVGTTNADNMTFTGDNTFSGTNAFSGANSYSGVSTHTALVIWAKGADVASGAALPVLTDGNYFDVTGTDAITSIDTLGIGTIIKLQFDDVLTLTHDAVDLVLPSGANITTAAGDEAEFVEYAVGDWRCTNYSKADGTAIVASSITLSAEQSTTSGTEFDFPVTSGAKRIGVHFVGNSLSGTDDILIQLEDAGGVETTSYTSRGENTGGGTVTSTAGFIIDLGSAPRVIRGTLWITLENAASFTWLAGGTMMSDANILLAAGSKSLSAELTSVRITRSGTDTFDAGVVSITTEV